MPTLSVIMSVYNEPIAWIQQAVDSILNQSFSDFEFIVVLDNPNGNEQISLLEHYQKANSRIILLYNTENIGLAASLNRAIKTSSGRYIARMDADDIAMSERFQRQLDYLNQHQDIQVCGTWAKRFGNLPRLSYKKFKFPVSPEETRIFSLFASPLVHPSVMARAEVMKKYMYNSEQRKAQDYDLWCRLICNDINVVSLPLYLMKYRVTAKSLVKENLSKQEDVARTVRGCLLSYQGIEATEAEISLHNGICGNSNASLEAIEHWLIQLKSILIEKLPQQKIYISDIVGEYWSVNCIRKQASYYYYCRSNLYPGFKWLTVLRFLKRTLHG